MLSWRDLSNIGKLAVAAAGIAVLVVVVWFIFIRPGQLHKEAVNAKADSAYSQGQATSAQEAIAAQDANQAADTNTDRQTQENSNAIHAAEGADGKVAPAVNAAGLRALCIRQLYRDTPQCRQVLKSGK